MSERSMEAILRLLPDALGSVTGGASAAQAVRGHSLFPSLLAALGLAAGAASARGICSSRQKDGARPALCGAQMPP
jgi:hypothetical protein